MAAEAIADKSLIMEKLVRGKCGWSPGEDAFKNLGRGVLQMEREYNLKAGLNIGDDDLPEFIRREPLPPHDSVFDVPMEEMNTFYNF
jgi:aldehyde:ferredoxin oxidoreductase